MGSTELSEDQEEFKCPETDVTIDGRLGSLFSFPLLSFPCRNNRSLDDRDLMLLNGLDEVEVESIAEFKDDDGWKRSVSPMEDMVNHDATRIGGYKLDRERGKERRYVRNRRGDHYLVQGWGLTGARRTGSPTRSSVLASS